MREFITFNALGIFSLIILAFLFVQANNYFDNEGKRHKQLWIGSIVATFISQLLDIVCWSLSGITGSEIRIISYILNSLCFVSFGVFSTVLAMFIEYNTDYCEKTFGFLKKILIPILLINIALSILSVPFEFYFRLDEANNYLRGNINFVSVVLCLFPIVFVVIRMLIKYKQERIQLKTTLLVGLMFPLAFTILQVSNIAPIPVQLPSVTLAILFLYLFLINSSIYVDFLTGLQNKRGVDKYFDDLPAVLNNYFVVIFLDLNGFKKINDVYGHKEGDNAIIAFSNIMSKVVRKNDLVARFGGDEFLIASIINSQEETEIILKRIEKELEIYNKNANKKYELSISYGISIAFPDTRIDKNKMIAEADERMYIQKNTTFYEKIIN